MRHRLFLANMSMLLLLSAACGDRMGRPIPGMQDSLHYFNRADYKIIRKLPDSVGFRIRSAKLEGTSSNRLILDLAVNRVMKEYSFPIIRVAKSFSATTIKPSQVYSSEEETSDSPIDKRLIYVLYGELSTRSRVYLRLPGRDSVLLELPMH